MLLDMFFLQVLGLLLELYATFVKLGLPSMDRCRLVGRRLNCLLAGLLGPLLGVLPPFLGGLGPFFSPPLRLCVVARGHSFSIP